MSQRAGSGADSNWAVPATVCAAQPADWVPLLVVAVILGVVDAVVWPVVFWLTAADPRHAWSVCAVNALMFVLTSRITGALGLGFRVDGSVLAFAGALVDREPSSELLCDGELVGNTDDDHSRALGGVTTISSGVETGRSSTR